MLLKVRLPTSPIPKMKELSLSSLSKFQQLQLGKSDVDQTLSSLPSSSSILLSLVAVFILVSFFRLLFIGLKEHLVSVKQRRQRQDDRSPMLVSSAATASEKSGALAADSNPVPPKFTSSWLWGFLQWESLPALPLDISRAPRSDCVGQGVGVGFNNEKKQSWPSPALHQPQPRRTLSPMMSQVNSGRRMGPAFDRPLPTIYQSDAPLSMAKIIMSRHTFRRPTSRPPPARSSNAVQIQRKVPLLPTTTPQASSAASGSSIPPPKSSLSRPPSPPSRSPSPPSNHSHSRSPSPPSSGSRSRSHSRSPSPPLLPTSYSPPPPSDDSLPQGSAASTSGASIV